MRVLGIDPGAECGLCVIELRQGLVHWCGGEPSRDPAKSSLFRDELLFRHEIALVAIEHVETVYPRERFSARMATAIAHSTHQAGLLRGLAQAAGVRVVEVTAAEWRKALTGRSQASDAYVKTVITNLVADWPRVSNAHVRDAAGVAVFAAQREAFLTRRLA